MYRSMNGWRFFGNSARAGWLLAALCLLAMGSFAAQGEQKAKPTVDMRLLTAEMAVLIARTALDECTRRGYQVAVAVVGREGNLQAFVRDSLAGPHTIEISLKKAYTAASTRQASGALGTIQPRLDSFADLTTIRGGLPVSIGGHYYGGVGVSGATSLEDEQCAQVGIDKVAEVLEFEE